ncbi:MAG TPA: alpha/beta family hydrolase [Candidatus Limnocylindria bacterium]|nr:alpha/beta family hydrolase [Candidatus Limnocylindria bacterium]
MTHPLLFLAPGASGNLATLRAWTKGLTDRGIHTRAVSLPRGSAERALPAYRAAAADEPTAFIGGHSFGGRVASLLAAERRVAGLILLCYPLHAPGAPERAAIRTVHWPSISAPVLLLSGDRDPFARIELLRAAVRHLPQAELVIYPGVGHGLAPVLDDALDRVAGWIVRLATLDR